MFAPNDPIAATAEERQLQFEHKALESGIGLYRKQQHSLCENDQAAATDWGKQVLRSSLAPMVAEIARWRGRKGAGRRHVAIQLCGSLTEDAIAEHVVKAVLNQLFNPRQEKTLCRVCLSIADSLLLSLQVREFRKQSPRLFKTVESRRKRGPFNNDPKRRASMIRHAANKHGVAISSWTKSEKLKVGRIWLEMFVLQTGLVTISEGRDRRKKSTRHLEASNTLTQWIDNAKGHLEPLHPSMFPMVCPPKPWTTLDDGGYLSLRPRFTGLVKARTKAHREELRRADLSQIFRCVNLLQNTGWRVNAWVYEQVKQAESMGYFAGDTLIGADLPLPPKPAAEPKSAEMKAWKLKAAEVFRHNKRMVGRRKQQVMILAAADKFVAEPTIYFPYQLDFRGRVYALPSFLNPQGNDLAKGLLTFADGKPLGKTGAWWLYVHCANCFGVDKVSFADRVAWTDSNSDRILATANEPFSDLWWMEADSPWQFLAACREVAHYLAEGESYVCPLPVAVDGSNNGLQHFSAMLRDPECGSLVNLIPTNTPADIYSAVAKRVNAVLEERKDRDDLARLWLLFGVDRKVCKRPVMIVPYGGKKDGVRQYIIDAIDGKKNHPFNQRVGEAANYLRDIVWDVMAEMMPGPRGAMNWLQEAASAVAEMNKPVTWLCPNGFIARQEYRQWEMRSVQVKYPSQEAGGKSDTLKVSYRMSNPRKIDGKKQVQSFSPNFVHSLDAAALTGTVNLGADNGLTHFACVHDSYGTHACDVETLQACIRDVFVRMYETDVLASLKAQLDPLLSKPLPAPPPMGTLDLQLVRKSKYFFA